MQLIIETNGGFIAIKNILASVTVPPPVQSYINGDNSEQLQPGLLPLDKNPEQHHRPSCFYLVAFSFAFTGQTTQTHHDQLKRKKKQPIPGVLM